LDDFQLIQGCLTADNRSWEEFVDRYSDLIYDTILRTFREHGCATQNKDIEDLHNDIFVFLLEDRCRALRLFEGRNGCRLGHYLRTITIRKTIDHLRRRRVMFSFDDVLSQEGSYEAKIVKELAAPDAFSALKEKEAHEIVGKLLAELREEDQQLCAMIYKDEKTPKVIAETLGIPVEHFYVSKARVLNKLRIIAIEKNYLTARGTPAV
jgi:RNA polymerase sigma factor (sigma-70 family)